MSVSGKRVAAAVVCVALALMGRMPHAQAAGQSWYVSPSGSASNAGTISSPLSLTAALSASGPVKPGDTVWLRGGTYKQSYVSELTGTATAPITVRQYPGERATLDGNNTSARNAGYVLLIMGSYTDFWGFEIMSSDANRVDSGEPNSPSGIVFSTSDHIRLINLIVHDMPGQGIGFWSYTTNSEIYGSLVYYNGIASRDHGIYAQNGAGSKLMTDNFVFWNAGYGFHIYGSSASLDNFTIVGNTLFDNGANRITGSRLNQIMFGGANGKNEIFRFNTAYNTPSYDAGENTNFGYGASLTNAVIEDNYFVGGSLALVLSGTTPTSMVRNSVYGGVSPSSMPSTYPSNSYYSSRPTGTWTRIRKNAFEPGRANVTVLNWAKTSSINLDLGAAGLVSGDSYEVRDTQNFFGAPIASGVYYGSPVSIPMTGLTAVNPVGTTLPVPVHTTAEFGAFVVLRTSSDPTDSDTAAPTVAITAPSSSQVLAGGTTLSASASDNAGVAGVRFYVDGVSAGAEDTTAPYSLSWDSKAVADGTHSVTAVARDAAGNQQTSAAVSFAVKNATADALPAVTVTAPTAGQSVTGTVSLTASASDDKGIAGVQFQVDGVNAGAEDTTAPYSVAWDAAKAAAGTHVITAVARDSAGQKKTSAGVSVTVSGGSAAPVALYLEAESGSRNSAMARYTDSTASGGRYVAATRDEAGQVRLTLSVPTSGTYVVWARVKVSSAKHDSFYVLADGANKDVFELTDGPWGNDWTWVQVNGRSSSSTIPVRKFNWSAGTHTLTFQGREFDTRLDQVLITNDLAFVPQ